MAADSATSADNLRTGVVDKIFKNSRGDLLGLCGSMALSGQFAKWFTQLEQGEKPALLIKERELNAMIVRETGEIEIHEDGGMFLYCRDIPDEYLYYAIGSGSGIALGAMHAGASAFDAVRAAVHHDIGTGGPIQTLRLGRD